MTLAEFVQVLQGSFSRSDKEAEGWYPKYVNRALRQIQKDRSWNCMFATTDLTIQAGVDGVALPSTFKELHSAQPSVFVHDPAVGSSLIPVTVTSRAEHNRFHAGSLWPPSGTATSNLEVFLESGSDGTWSLNVKDSPTDDIVLRVHYYGFLADLALDGDSNFLTTEYPDLCLAKVKEVAFMDINDPISIDFLNLYQQKLPEAVRDDSRRRYSGRRMRMGG
jgi:hypothetical protein